MTSTVNDAATAARSATPATVNAVTEASATLAAAMRATCFLPAGASLVIVMSACPRSASGSLAAGPPDRTEPADRDTWPPQ